MKVHFTSLFLVKHRFSKLVRNYGIVDILIDVHPFLCENMSRACTGVFLKCEMLRFDVITFGTWSTV